MRKDALPSSTVTKEVGVFTANAARSLSMFLGLDERFADRQVKDSGGFSYLFALP